MSKVKSIDTNRVSVAIITATILCILVITLFPYDFFFVETIADFTWEGLVARADRPIPMPLEFLANIIMFVPLGFGYALRLQRKTLAAWLVVISISFATTLAIESLQIFLPSRTPSPSDLIANTLGGGLGFVLWQYWQPLSQSRWIHQIRGLQAIAYRTITKPLLPYWQFIKPRPKTQRSLMAIALCSYCCLTLWGTLALRNASPWGVSNWDSTYPLLLGNEVEGARPWSGQISNVQIYAQQLDSTAIQQLLSQPEQPPKQTAPIAHYPLTGAAPFADQTSHLPDLVWQGQPPLSTTSLSTTSTLASAQPISLSPQRWLETRSPPAELVQQVKAAQAFTISFTAQTANSEQSGPARILSLSDGPYYRNLTIGQQGSHLSLRLRTPITKDNGQRPEFIVPNVFSSTAEPHHLILTYSANQLALYIDTLTSGQKLRFSPEMTLFWKFAPPFLSTIHINSATSLFCRLLYRGLWLLPIGIMMAFITTSPLKNGLNNKPFKVAVIAVVTLFYGLLEMALH
ncbi:MAG: VanZ family protein [Phormidesmis sp.]